ncbi:hypothetical protein AAW14_34890 [Streptomyces hygroscopicus]|uniref:cation:proton antiporter domain-containing protein n=1 Tax=Streptomyces hygroscopicus TaxID=1912 RepID=UPI00223EA5E5|nr:cation:proton antiporter [Streptomyces hygroscopicus]MCW7947012.1 hypothetical protein [Streptomyces hygroscopicus]
MTRNPTELLGVAMADIALVLLAGVLLTPLFLRLRQLRVIAEIAAGIALGPSLLGLLPGHLPDRLFPPEVRPRLQAVTQVGILLFMFLVGWLMRASHFRSGRGTVLGVSLSSVAVPLLSGAALALGLHHDHDFADGHPVGRTTFALFVGTAMAVTAFPVLARIIDERGLGSADAGAVALASAAVSDVLAWFLLAVVSIVAASAGPGRLLRIVCGATALAAVLAFVVRPLLRLLVGWAGRRGDRSTQVLVVAAGVLLCGFAADQIGLDAIFGAFAFGLAMPRDEAEQTQADIRMPMEHVAALPLPVFFITTGLSVDVTKLGGQGALELAAVCATACAGKVLGAGGAARLGGMSWADARTVGLLMNTRGLTELVVLNTGRSMGVLDDRMYTVLVVMALVTTAMAGPLMPRPGPPEAAPPPPRTAPAWASPPPQSSRRSPRAHSSPHPDQKESID